MITKKDNFINELKEGISSRDTKINKLKNLLWEYRTLGFSPGDTLRHIKNTLIIDDRDDEY